MSSKLGYKSKRKRIPRDSTPGEIESEDDERDEQDEDYVPSSDDESEPEYDDDGLDSGDDEIIKEGIKAKELEQLHKLEKRLQKLKIEHKKKP